MMEKCEIKENIYGGRGSILGRRRVADLNGEDGSVIGRQQRRRRRIHFLRGGENRFDYCCRDTTVICFEGGPGPGDDTRTRTRDRGRSKLFAVDSARGRF